MRVICLDREGCLSKILRALPQVDEAVDIDRAEDALDWMSRHTTNLVFLDMELPDLNGLELAGTIKKRYPDVAVVLFSETGRYALDAFTLRLSGYLVKPVSRERLEEELEYLSTLRGKRSKSDLEMRTFGSFACLVKGEPISFRQAKCKELLAYLVDRRGSSVTRAEAFAILWEDRLYDRPMQKQLDVIIRSLRATLREKGIDSILEVKNGSMRLNLEMLHCDLYRFLAGDIEAIHAYRGEYMNGYSWAEMTESYLSERIALIEA